MVLAVEVVEEVEVASVVAGIEIGMVSVQFVERKGVVVVFPPLVPHKRSMDALLVVEQSVFLVVRLLDNQIKFDFNSKDKTETKNK